MAKFMPADREPTCNVFSSVQATKERVRRAFARHRESLAGMTTIPTHLTVEMKRDIALGRPVINQ